MAMHAMHAVLPFPLTIRLVVVRDQRLPALLDICATQQSSTRPHLARTGSPASRLDAQDAHIDAPRLAAASAPAAPLPAHPSTFSPSRPQVVRGASMVSVSDGSSAMLTLRSGGHF